MAKFLRLNQVFSDHKSEPTFVFRASVKYFIALDSQASGNTVLHLEGMERIAVLECAADIANGYSDILGVTIHEPDFKQDGSPAYINLDRVRSINPRTDHALVYFADNTKLKIKPHAQFPFE